MGTARGETVDMPGKPWFWWDQKGDVWSKGCKNGFESLVRCASGCMAEQTPHIVTHVCTVTHRREL